MPKEKETEKKPLNKGLIFKWWGRWDLNPHGINSQRILSPLRLPISPRPHIFWRFRSDLNRWSQSCSLLPYHLATEPYRVLIPTSPASVLTNLLLWYYITFWKKCKLFFKFFLFFLQKVFWCVYISFKNYF